VKLEEIWTERDLVERLNLKIGKTGRCRTLSKWITQGLKYMEKDGHRYFWEGDIVDFLQKFQTSEMTL